MNNLHRRRAAGPEGELAECCLWERADEEMVGSSREKYLLYSVTERERERKPLTCRMRNSAYICTYASITFTARGSAADLSKIYVVTFCDSMVGITNDFTFYAGV